MISITQQSQTTGNAVAPKTVTFKFDAAADLTGTTFYNDATGTTPLISGVDQYDGADRLTNITYTADAGDYTGDTFAAYVWQYDSADRVSSFTNSATYADYSAENVGTYYYDTANQLIGVDSDPETNPYDANGNRIDTGEATNVIGKGNRLLSDGVWNYSFDLNGNLISQVGVADGPQDGVGNRLFLRRQESLGAE